jgi:hypothetical protein
MLVSASAMIRAEDLVEIDKMFPTVARSFRYQLNEAIRFNSDHLGHRWADQMNSIQTQDFYVSICLIIYGVEIQSGSIPLLRQPMVMVALLFVVSYGASCLWSTPSMSSTTGSRQLGLYRWSLNYAR